MPYRTNRAALTPWIASVLLLAATPVFSRPLPAAGEGGKCGLAARLVESGLATPFPGLKAPVLPTTPAAYQTSRTIGSFRFNYDTTGMNAPALLDGGGARIPGSHEAFVDSAGEIFNEVLAAETEDLGYGSPLQPGQTAYDVNIFNSLYYGETVPESRIGFSTPSRWRSHINIENDFQNFYTPGIAGLRVTAAHEFHHAIQFAAYGFWSGDGYFMELTSTWMEDILYDDINDYYQYVRAPAGGSGYTQRGVFAQPDVSFLRSDGLIEYSRAVFGKFIEKQYSRDVMRRAWELVPTAVAITALDRALGERGSSFRTAFADWVRWNAETGPDADTATFYSEGREYPPVRTRPRIGYIPPGRNFTDSIQTTSAAYFPVAVQDTVMTVTVLNTSTPGTPAKALFEYQMSDDGDNTYRQLENGLFVRLVVPDPLNWEAHESVPTTVEPTVYSGINPSPNPLRNWPMKFHLPRSSTAPSVRLKVLTPAMEEVFDGVLPLAPDPLSAANLVAEWPGTDRYGRQVGSGVFVYILSVDGVDHTGKIAVVR